MSDVSKPFQARRFGLAILLLALSSAVVAHRQTPGRSATPKPAVAPRPAAASTDWKEIDRLVSEQKFEEAAAAVARRRSLAGDRLRARAETRRSGPAR